MFVLLIVVELVTLLYIHLPAALYSANIFLLFSIAFNAMSYSIKMFLLHNPPQYGTIQRMYRTTF